MKKIKTWNNSSITVWKNSTITTWDNEPIINWVNFNTISMVKLVWIIVLMVLNIVNTWLHYWWWDSQIILWITIFSTLFTLVVLSIN